MPGVTGESVAATSTNIFPSGMGTDYSGNLYVADTTGAIRKIDVTTGIITKVAGTGDNITGPYTGDGIAATSCHIGPLGIAVDSGGNIYVADMTNSRAEKINTSGIIKTIAGTGVLGFSGDGASATNATFNYLENVALDVCGNVYIADFGNHRLRKISFNPDCLPVGFSEVKKDITELVLFPNPVSHTLSIACKERIESVCISNPLGLEVIATEGRGSKQEIDVRMLPAGMYFVRVNEVWVGRFLKE